MVIERPSISFREGDVSDNGIVSQVKLSRKIMLSNEIITYYCSFGRKKQLNVEPEYR